MDAFRFCSLALALLAAACGHASLATEGPELLRIDDARITVGGLGTLWRRIDGERGVTFRRLDEPSIVITVNATCKEVEDAPLDVLTNHLLFGLTQRNFESRELVPFDGREAERSLLMAKLDGVPFRLATVVLKKNGCVVDLFFAAPPDRFETHRPEFERLVDGFRLISNRSS